MFSNYISVGIVLCVMADEVVEIFLQYQLVSDDSKASHTYLGFPYCVAMMLGSVLLHLIAEITMGAHLYEPKTKKRGKTQQAPSYEYYQDVVIEAPKTKPATYDSTILSEKL